MKTTIDLFNKKPQMVVLVLLLLFAGFYSCKDDDDDDDNMPAKVNYSGSFVKSAEAVETAATGTATAAFDPTTMELAYSLSWSGLGTNAVNMHFHNAGPVMAGIEGFPSETSGTVSGKVTLNAQQVLDLAAGKIYAQIHTVGYPGGEVIATLTKSSSPNPSSNSGGGGY